MWIFSCTWDTLLCNATFEATLNSILCKCRTRRSHLLSTLFFCVVASIPEHIPISYNIYLYSTPFRFMSMHKGIENGWIETPYSRSGLKTQPLPPPLSNIPCHIKYLRNLWPLRWANNEYTQHKIHGLYSKPNIKRCYSIPHIKYGMRREGEMERIYSKGWQVVKPNWTWLAGLIFYLGKRNKLTPRMNKYRAYIIQKLSPGILYFTQDKVGNFEIVYTIFVSKYYNTLSLRVCNIYIYLHWAWDDGERWTRLHKSWWRWPQVIQHQIQIGGQGAQQL